MILVLVGVSVLPIVSFIDVKIESGLMLGTNSVFQNERPGLISKRHPDEVDEVIFHYHRISRSIKRSNRQYLLYRIWYFQNVNHIPEEHLVEIQNHRPVNLNLSVHHRVVVHPLPPNDLIIITYCVLLYFSLGLVLENSSLRRTSFYNSYYSQLITKYSLYLSFFSRVLIEKVSKSILALPNLSRVRPSFGE